jgi:hypothetical protein
MDLNSIWSDEKKVKALTGLKKEELLDIASLFFDEIERNQDSKGRPRKLSDENLLLLLLTEYKHNLTFELLSVMFEIDKVLQDVLKKKNYLQLIPTTPRKKQKDDYSIKDLYALMAKSNQ